MTKSRGSTSSATLDQPIIVTPGVRQVITFEENKLVANLLGEFHSHLAMIEDRLGIEAVAHGNVVTLSGPKIACDVARDILGGLYERLDRGEVIGPGEVEGAIRHFDIRPEVKPERREGRAAKDKKSSPLSHQKNKALAQIKTRKRVITARTIMQSHYIRALESQDMVFATGPAGTGKTYLAVAHAAACLERREVDRLILSRPAVEAGERLGFLPGDMRDKVDPYLRPLYDALYDVLPSEKVERDLENGTIEIAPLAFMRGRTLSHAMIIFDEAQNCTHMQMKMFLTRLGEQSKMVITGDPTQVDLPKGQESGLQEAIRLLAPIEAISQIAFSPEDVVRRALVAEIVEAYDRGLNDHPS